VLGKIYKAAGFKKAGKDGTISLVGSVFVESIITIKA
jgi:hypothetical protein